MWLLCLPSAFQSFSATEQFWEVVLQLVQIVCLDFSNPEEVENLYLRESLVYPSLNPSKIKHTC